MHEVTNQKWFVTFVFCGVVVTTGAAAWLFAGY